MQDSLVGTAELSVYGLWTSVVRGLVASASPGNLSGRQVLWLHPGPSESETLGVMSQILHVILSGTCLSLEAPPTQNTEVNRTHTLHQGMHS